MQSMHATTLARVQKVAVLELRQKRPRCRPDPGWFPNGLPRLGGWYPDGIWQDRRRRTFSSLQKNVRLSWLDVVGIENIKDDGLGSHVCRGCCFHSTLRKERLTLSLIFLSTIGWRCSMTTLTCFSFPGFELVISKPRVKLIHDSAGSWAWTFYVVGVLNF